MQPNLYIGMMSGTSLDGVDTVIVDFSNTFPRIVASLYAPMPQDLRDDLTDLMRGVTTLQKLGEIEQRLSWLYVEQVREILQQQRFAEEQIIAIGCHGQTVWHAPTGKYPFTVQLVDGNLLAAQTGITTITDFRRKDMAYGGQGAPLVPAFHQAIFSNPKHLTVLLNIGGISNVTVLYPDGTVSGFDTGPGNTLMDNWIKLQQGRNFDQNGEWAAQGQVNKALLQSCLQTEYFHQLPPKSTGRELFNLPWLQQKLDVLPQIAAVDVQATLLELTAQTIVAQLPKTQTETTLWVFGGGASNPVLMQRLQDLLPHWYVRNSNQSGIDADFMEAAAFAWLAYRTINHQSGNLPSVTGASQRAILGAIYLADKINKDL